MNFENCSSVDFYIWFKQELEKIKEDIPSYLDFLTKFSDTTILNPALIYLQNPLASMVLDKYSWKLIHNREVVDENKPIYFVSTLYKDNIPHFYFFKGYDINNTKGSEVSKKIITTDNTINYNYSEDEFLDNCVIYVVQKMLSRDINLKYDTIPENSACSFSRFEFVLMSLQENVQNTLLNSSDFKLDEHLKTLNYYSNLNGLSWLSVLNEIQSKNDENLRNGFLKLFTK